MPALEDSESPRIDIDDDLQDSSGHRAGGPEDSVELASIQEEDNDIISGEQHSIPEFFEGERTAEEPPPGGGIQSHWA